MPALKLYSIFEIWLGRSSGVNENYDFYLVRRFKRCIFIELNSAIEIHTVKTRPYKAALSYILNTKCKNTA